MSVLRALARSPRLRELALFVPHLARLVAGVVRDERVPWSVKAGLAGAALYLASPVDLLPDFIPVVGYLDDLLVAAVILDALLNQVDRQVLFDHWPGDPATLERCARVAGRLAAFVPRRLRARIFAGPVR